MMITIDMDKARDIVRDGLRRARAARLAQLDIEYQRADENGESDRKLLVAREKQKLRDMTRREEIENAKSPDELKAALSDLLAEIKVVSG